MNSESVDDIAKRWKHPDACDICGIVTPCPTSEHVYPPDFTFTWCDNCVKDAGATFRFMTDAITKYHTDREAKDPVYKAHRDKLRQQNVKKEETDKTIFQVLMLLTFLFAMAATYLIMNFMEL